MPDFPVLDATYAVANAELGRVVIQELGTIEPHVDETDASCTIPIEPCTTRRPMCSPLELGPYSLSETDICRLREAIRAFDAATSGGRNIRRVK